MNNFTSHRHRLEIIALSIFLMFVATVSEGKTFKVRGKDGKAIQQTIDRAFSKGGGKVVVPAGVYNVASIRLRSNIELNLEEGAVLLGSTNSADYDSLPEEICSINPEKSTKTLLFAYNSENIALTGLGVIDGQGPTFFDIDPARPGLYPKPPVERPLMVKIVHCKNIRMQGITLKDSPCWTVLLRLCENIVVNGITITADQKMINNDGIDFDGCAHVRVSNSNFKTCDDCIVLRAMKESPDQHVVCEDIIVENCNLNSACQTIRLGCPSDDTIRNAKFINIRAEGNNGIFADYPKRYLSKNDTGKMDISNIEFDNYSGELYGSALQIVSEPGVTPRRVDNFVFRNIDVKSRMPLRFIGNHGHEIGSVILENFKAEVQNGPAPYQVRGCNGLEFKNVIINGVPIPDGPVTGEKGSEEQLGTFESSSWERLKN